MVDRVQKVGLAVDQGQVIGICLEYSVETKTDGTHKCLIGIMRMPEQVGKKEHSSRIYLM